MLLQIPNRNYLDFIAFRLIYRSSFSSIRRRIKALIKETNRLRVCPSIHRHANLAYGASSGGIDDNPSFSIDRSETVSGSILRILENSDI